MSMPFDRPDIIRPPSEWGSYFLPLTKGCSNSSCTFCGYYGAKLQMRQLDDAKAEIDAVALYIRSGVRVASVPEIAYYVAQRWDGRRVFLQDADALVYPFIQLREVLRYVMEKWPHVERIGCYATPQDILRRSRDELEELKRLNLGILYMGVESGDDEVLEKVGKGVNRRQMIEAGRKVKEAGIALSVTVILGLGGVEGSEKHTAETAEVLTAIDPDYAGALTLTLIPGSPLYEEWQRGQFEPVSPFASLEELKRMIELSSFSDCFFSSMHASNYLSVRGRLPREKERMLEEVAHALRSGDPSLLRPEFLRGL